MLVNHLEYFIEVVETKSFTKAAENLFISQSTISKAVRSIEEELSVKLIERSPHEFIITKEGEYVYNFAKDVFSYYDLREKELHFLIEKQSNTLKFGLPPSAGSVYFHNLISRFKANYPETNLLIEEETSNDIVKDLRNEKLDIGVIIEPYNTEEFKIIRVLESESVLVVPFEHELAKKDIVDFSSLRNEKFIQMSEKFMYYDLFMKYCKIAGFVPNIVFKSDQFDLVLEMVIENQGVTILPKPLVDKFLNNRAHVIKLENPIFPWTLTIAYLKNKVVTKPMKNFIDICNDKKIKNKII